MSDFILDYRALGLNPDWENILIDIIDLELGFIENPRHRFIIAYILQGYSHKETASKIGISRCQLYREIAKIRKGKSS